MTTPTPPAETETALARRYRIEVDMGTTGTPAWTLLPGVQEFAPKVEPTQQESTTYEDEGWADNTTTKLAWTAEIKLAHRCHPDTGEFNAAQVAVKKASERFGAASAVHVRFYDREGRDDAYEGRALVQWEPDGGSSEDLDTVKVTLTGKGRLAEIENPVTSGAEGQSLAVAPLMKKVAA
ncbi:phage tail tube protein [Streptomyces sp. CH6]|uniref:phage tail tube protein n=1 Tax=unclassified Streptomyces TaxID=2593676 RepID=UPI003CFCC461